MRNDGFAWAAVGAAAVLLVFAPFTDAKAATVKGVVQDGSKQPVAGATVFLVPAADVAKLAKAPSFKIRAERRNDEPMDDNRRQRRQVPAGGDRQEGRFSIARAADGKYFVYVGPRPAPARRHLTNKAMTAAELGEAARDPGVREIPPNATFIGSSKCMKCHDDYVDFTKTVHKQGIMVVGKPSKLQDTSRFPGLNDGLKKLQAGTKIYFYGYDKGRGFDKYQISEKPPADLKTVSFTATFYKDTDGTLKLHRERADPADTARPIPSRRPTAAPCTSSATCFASATRPSLPAVQHRGQGRLGRPDAQALARLPRRLAVQRRSPKKLADPPVKKSFEIECASCHYTGYALTPTVGRRLRRRRGQRPERRDGHRRRRRAQRAQHRLRKLPRPRLRAREGGREGVDDRQPGQALGGARHGDLQPVPQPAPGQPEERPADQQGQPDAHPGHQPQRVPGQPHHARRCGAGATSGPTACTPSRTTSRAPTWSARRSTSTAPRS